MKGKDADSRAEKIDAEIEQADLPVVDGELLEVPAAEDFESVDDETKLSSREERPEIGIRKTQRRDPNSEKTKLYSHYLLLPFIFLTVSLLGGLRIGGENAEFIFLRPPLACLVFAVFLIALFVRARLIEFDGWFSERFSTTRNLANGAIILSLFFASAQIFNSLIPEQGLPFWVIGFCFLWTLWNNLFAEFDAKKLLRSLGGLFGFAFFAKYLILANLVSAEKGSWLERVWNSPTQEAFTYFLEIPRFGPATGYIQFFSLMLFMIGLFFLSPRSR